MDKIVRVRARLVDVPLPKPVAWANVQVRSREYVLVWVETADGAAGSGFTVGSRFKGGGAVIKALVEEVFAPVVVGRTPAELRGLWDEMYFRSLLLGRRGAAMRALSAVDIALWDLQGQKSGLALCDLLGRCRSSVPAYASGGYYHDAPLEEEIRHTTAEVRAAVERGFKAVKIKIGRLDRRADGERVRAVLDEVGPDVRVAVDANHAWRDAASAIDDLRRLDDLGLWWIEEPVLPDQLDASARIADKLVTPVATGEIEAGLRGFKEIVDSGAASILQADVTVVGGVTEWCKIAALAQAADLALAPHWVPEIHVQLGASMANVLTLEHFHPSVGVLNFDSLLENPVEVVDGLARVPEGPGHGMRFDLAAIERFEVVA